MLHMLSYQSKAPDPLRPPMPPPRLAPVCERRHRCASDPLGDRGWCGDFARGQRPSGLGCGLRVDLGARDCGDTCDCGSRARLDPSGVRSCRYAPVEAHLFAARGGIVSAPTSQGFAVIELETTVEFERAGRSVCQEPEVP